MIFLFQIETALKLFLKLNVQMECAKRDKELFTYFK